MFNKVVIIGLGLIGGSLARALKNSDQVKSVIGIDIDKKSVTYAIENGFIDSGFEKIDSNVHDAEIIIIATYVDLIIKIASELTGFISDKTVVSDVGSVKASIVKNIELEFKNSYQFVGAHPISGTENSGIEFSDPALFSGKKCILTPTSTTNPDAIEKVEALWRVAGSAVIKISPELHDTIFSYVSHLPHVVAYCLINSISGVTPGIDLFDFAGGGLRDFTRIASSSPEMWASIFMENKKELLNSISDFKVQVDLIEKSLANNDASGLKELLDKSKSLKNKL